MTISRFVADLGCYGCTFIKTRHFLYSPSFCNRIGDRGGMITSYYRPIWCKGKVYQQNLLDEWESEDEWNAQELSKG